MSTLLVRLYPGMESYSRRDRYPSFSALGLACTRKPKRIGA